MMIRFKQKILTFLAAIILVAGLCFYSESQSRPAITVTDTTAGTPLPVIVYHNIVLHKNGMEEVSVTLQELETDLVWLKSQGYTAVSAKETVNCVTAGSPLPEKPILLHFESGYRSFYQTVYPLLKKHGIHAVVSVSGMHSDILSASSAYPYLDLTQLKELTGSGLIEVGNRTYNLFQKTEKRAGCQINSKESIEQYRSLLTDDIGKWQEKLNQMTGTKPLLFSYPVNSYCKESVLPLKEMGIMISLGAEEGITNITGPESLYNMKRYVRTSEKDIKSYLKNSSYSS